MADQAAQDLTTGSPFAKLLRFSVPIVLGSLVQQLYSFADTVVVGRFIGPDALGAVGTTYALNFLVLGFVQGVGIGFGIPVAQRFGARDEEGFLRYLWNGVWVALVLSLALAAVMITAAGPLLVALGTPAEFLPMAIPYIAVVFAGIPITLLYNFSASVMRAVGDSRRPFIFLSVSCAVNVVLDLVFILVLHMGVVGSALGDVLGTLLATALTCWWGFAHEPWIRCERRLMGCSPAHVRRLCAIGLPMGFEYSVSAVGALALQGAINALGAVAVTAQTTGEKIRQLFTLPMESVGMAVASYAGQNFGARRYDRIRQGIASAALIQLLYCAVVWVVIFVCKGALVQFVLGVDAGPAIMEGAVEYLAIISCFFAFHGLLMVFRNTLQGMGHSVLAIVSGMCELAGRVVGSAWALADAGFLGICLANPLAWAFALVCCVIMVSLVLRR